MRFMKYVYSTYIIALQFIRKIRWIPIYLSIDSVVRKYLLFLYASMVGVSSYIHYS